MWLNEAVNLCVYFFKTQMTFLNTGIIFLLKLKGKKLIHAGKG